MASDCHLSPDTCPLIATNAGNEIDVFSAVGLVNDDEIRLFHLDP